MPDMPRITQMTPKSAAAAALVHKAAFPDHFLTSLGRPFLTLYYRSVAEDPDTIALMAVVDEHVRGLCVGAVDPRGFYTRLLKRRLLSFAVQGARAAVTRPSAIPRLFGALGHPSSQVPDPHAAGLFSLAVDPSAQGNGIGQLLVREFIAESARLGATKVVLETDDIGNDRVNAFYERLGFVVADKYTTSQERVMRRYTLSLQEEQDTAANTQART